MQRIILFIIFLCCISGIAAAQVQKISGTIKDVKTGEPIIGAVVMIKNTSIGTVTDFEGSFTIKNDKGFPVTLVVSYVGYEGKEIVLSSPSSKIDIRLPEKKKEYKEVEVVDSRISEKQKQAPLSVETVNSISIKETPSASFYEGLALLKGVDLNAASIGMKTLNTRGFNSSNPIRSLQLIDGVDNQAPGLNFALGNFLGASELDIQKVELVSGASSAYYGPNAFNGVINMQTKSPFQYPGLSAQFKAGERNFLECNVRWAQVFKNKSGEDKIGYKLNVSYMKALDWEATNLSVTSQSPVNRDNPGGYDAVNIYGDEYSSPIFHSQLSNTSFVGQGYYFRNGYHEKDIADYNTKNLKVGGAVHYMLNKKTELIYASNFATGTTVIQGDNRFSLRDVLFFQNRVELKQEGKFLIRAYATNEDAGNTFDIYSTALLLQNAVKSDENWGTEYRAALTGGIGSKVGYWYVANRYWLDSIPAANEVRLNFIDDYWRTFLRDTVGRYHNLGRERANTETDKGRGRFEPGSVLFDSAFKAITSRTNREGGSKFFDQSALYHITGEYRFSFRTIDFITGGNFRLYAPYSKGTIYLDTLPGQRIYNKEGGLYLGIEQKYELGRGTMKIGFINRLDKNENFDYLWSPAVSMVYVMKAHVFRISGSSALRNPTLQDQYINLNVGRATLLGNLHGFDSLVTIPSLIEAFNAGNKMPLRYFNVDAVKPEKVQTIELGYRGNINEKFYVDAVYYYSWYTDFIGYKIGADVDWEGLTEIKVKVYRIATNSKQFINTQGLTVGGNWFIKKYLGLSANYSWNFFNRAVLSDSLIPAYNTPEHKYNIGVSGRDITSNIGPVHIRHWGYNINYKWQQQFIFEGSPQFTGTVPSYDMVDAQVNKMFPSAHMTIKIGASNLLDNRVYQIYGGPYIGRMAYISILCEFDTR